MEHQDHSGSNLDDNWPAGVKGVGKRTNLILGENVAFGGNVLLYCNAPIEIGDNTIVGINATIHTSTHNYNDHPIWTKRIDRPVKIGKHVWIGTTALILPGVIIEDYAVVGSGSVVTANVPKGAIVAGNPAVIIKIRQPCIYEKTPLITNPSEAVIVKEGFLTRYCKERKR